MKIFCLLFCAAAVSAPVPAAAMELGDVYGALLLERPGVEAPSVPRPAGNSLNGRFCWTANPDQDGAGLGMPVAFCVNSARIVKKGDAYEAEITGQPYGTRQRNAWKTTKGWKVSIFHNSENSGACDEARHAAVNVEFAVDELGYMTGVPAAEGYYEETPDTCHSQYERKEIKFSRSGLGAARYAWRRGPSQLADVLGMPAEISFEGVSLHEKRLVIEKGAPLTGSFPAQFRQTAGGLLVEAVLFSAGTGGACTEGTMAEVSVAFLAGPDGAILAAPELSARTGKTWDVCHSPFEYSEIAFDLK
ncbi:MAG: hypothetical protein NDI60_00570 [Elusimicrobiales bacterium]|nr:hypothetical protein [Elusimicrobiales bacterium]